MRAQAPDLMPQWAAAHRATTDDGLNRLADGQVLLVRRRDGRVQIKGGPPGVFLAAHIEKLGLTLAPWPSRLVIVVDGDIIVGVFRFEASASRPVA
jgi:hypothetical protein